MPLEILPAHESTGMGADPPAFSLGRKRGMSAYLVILLGGEGSFEVEADFYGQDRDDFVFTCEGREVRRIPMFEVGSISKEK